MAISHQSLIIVQSDHMKEFILRTCNLYPIIDISEIYQEGVLKVSVQGQFFVLKEPSSPESGGILHQELLNLLRLNLPSNIVRLKRIAISEQPYTTKPKPVPSSFVVRGILIEYHEKGDLSAILRSKEEISWTERVEWVIHIRNGLKDMHAAGLAHFPTLSSMTTMRLF